MTCNPVVLVPLDEGIFVIGYQLDWGVKFFGQNKVRCLELLSQRACKIWG